MASWTVQPGNVYIRDLGLNELGFYYDSHINGTADTVGHTTIAVSPTARHCVAPQSITRAWCHLKNLFPLLAATVQLRNSLPQFVVTPQRLASLVQGEITVSSIASAEEAHAAAVYAINGARMLSDDLLSRIIVLARTDDTSTYHVLIQVAHLITDGVSNTSILRTFLNILSSPEELKGPDVKARLALAVAAESLVPTVENSARQRWRRAAGQIICQLQDAKRTGGQTLPRSFGPIATRLPARSGWLRTYFSAADSSRFIQNCRAHGITVGNALPVLAQVGLARLLCRRFVRGEMSLEEWEFRRQQPYHTAGPINLRPFLDKAWYQAGGYDSASVNVAYFYFTSSFTPLGPKSLALGDSVPELAKLMSPQRFLLRCNKMKKLASRYLTHPLFFEIGASRLANKPALQKNVAAKWEKNPESYVQPGELERHNVSPMEQVKYGPIMSHGWSTFGNTDDKLPREYPIPKAGASSSPVLRLQKHEGFLHCRTGELYLGSGTIGGQMYFSLNWDRNVFSDEVVHEWVNETQQAAHFYLGDSASSKL
ncbi:hypothetical protein GGX14DRAFT_591750 [Mycena pura]|uniref:Uncharacterized protein n=1 Tax=Mycena pura TaxID=153505 RepID=A0AAD6VSU7_9AGAR|nr:hypothetical protein GGX14DRAFT_591750 [Mycena pura]